MERERTVSALTAQVAPPVTATHHGVRRLVNVGRTRHEPQRGRPVRHDRAAPPAFLAPDHATPLNSLEDLIGLHEESVLVVFKRAVVRAGLALAKNHHDLGLRLYMEGTRWLPT